MMTSQIGNERTMFVEVLLDVHTKGQVILKHQIMEVYHMSFTLLFMDFNSIDFTLHDFIFVNNNS